MDAGQTAQQGAKADFLQRTSSLSGQLFRFSDEGKYFVSQGLNIDVASCGDTAEEAVDNLRDAVELYLKDDDTEQEFQAVEHESLGETVINA